MTVTVIDPSNQRNVTINDSDFDVHWISGTGKGGQHRNKKKTSCRVIHRPTGLSETRQGRSRELNLQDAKQSLIHQIKNITYEKNRKDISNARKDQAGSGMRGDKIRTYRFQDDIVTDHNLNTSHKCGKVMKGYFDLLWK